MGSNLGFGLCGTQIGQSRRGRGREEEAVQSQRHIEKTEMKKKRSGIQESSQYRKICPQTEPVYREILRNMDGEKKLKIAFELYEIALNLSRQSVLEQNPNITEKELKQLLLKRFSYGPRRFIDKSSG